MPLSTILLCALVVVFSTTSPSLAQETDQDMPVGAVGGSVHADLFTGTATTSIPIEVPPGRGGVQPSLALVYGSANGNGLGSGLDFIYFSFVLAVAGSPESGSISPRID